MYSDEWTVCFVDVERKHWIQRILKKGFSHCFAFKTSSCGTQCIIVEPMRSHVCVDTIEQTAYTFDALTENTRFVTVSLIIEAADDRGGFCRFNCVEVVKSLLGIKAFWTFTPHQLYKRLQNGWYI